MAKLKVFAPYDSKLSLWMQPMFFQQAGQAERIWKELCNDPASMLAKHASDFTLYQIGEYDDENASLTSIAPVQLMTASQARQTEPVSRIS